MVEDFFATTVDDWTDPAGMLHAYLVPDATTLGRLAPVVAAISQLDYLAPQPIDALHATIQRFPFLIRDLDGAALGRLRGIATDDGTRLAPVRLRFDAPAPVVNAVLIRAVGDDQWAGLLRVVRGAATAALGPRAEHYGPPFGPHITLAYATATGDDGEIASALAADSSTAAPVGEMVFREIAWCAVHQNREAGTYTFETLFATPLSG